MRFESLVFRLNSPAGRSFVGRQPFLERLDRSDPAVFCFRPCEIAMNDPGKRTAGVFCMRPSLSRASSLLSLLQETIFLAKPDSLVSHSHTSCNGYASRIWLTTAINSTRRIIGMRGANNEFD